MLLLTSVVCVIVVKRQWISYCFIARRLLSCVFFPIFWGFLGLMMNVTRYYFWLEELVGEALIRHLEFGTVMLDVVYMEGE